MQVLNVTNPLTICVLCIHHHFKREINTITALMLCIAIQHFKCTPVSQFRHEW